MHGTTRDAIRAVLADNLASDPRRVLLGESVYGLAGSRAGLSASHPDQVLVTPIAERATLGMALGMALAGKKPVVEISSTGRLLACLEVLTEACSIARAGEFSVPLVVRVAAGDQAGDRIDRPMADQLSRIDGLQVVCGSSPGSVVGALKAALGSSMPTILLEPRPFYSRRIGEVSNVVIGQASVPREGEHVTLVSWGTGVQVALEAAEELLTDGITSAVVDLLALSPLDSATLGSWVRTTGRLVCVEAAEGGLSPSVLQASLREAFLYLESPLTTSPGSRADVVSAAHSAVSY
jgi:2-oxoisovalerate dehydrogenase E1 component